jgi:superfamily I DNA/RNA helicase
VPAEWLKDVKAATEDTLLVLADHLPAEAAEALLELATGGTPRVPPLPVPSATPFDHPDAQRRFRTVASVEELERALDSPWEKWTVFLHPDQRDTVERNYAGPARVSGSAGTGKTIAALHRAVHLARTNPESRVLLTTFSDTLANALRPKLRRLLGNEPRLGERIDLYSLNAIGLRLYKSYIGEVTIGGDDIVRELVREAANSVGGHSFAQRFLVSEWEQVVDAWQLQEWEAYRDVARLGRKTRLPEAQRKVLWSILGRVRAGLKSRNLMTYPALFTALAAVIGKRTVPFDFAVVDEAQDIGVAHIKFFAALGGLASSLLAGFVRHQLVAHAQPGCPASQEGTGCATRNDGNLEDQERGVRLCGVDEAQDVSIAHVRFLAALGDGRPDALFFAGDLGQRIFQQPFSWKALGVDIRGRSRTLRVNYRTSHQIRTQADRLLGPVVTDVDGNSDDRSDTVSVFNGPPPTIQTLKSEDEEIKAVADWIAGHSKAGVMPQE